MARAAPIFTQKLSLKRDGATVVFTAEAEAVPRPTAAWFRGEAKLEAGDRIRAKAEQLGKSNKYRLTLTIKDAGPDDSGTYRVEVRNSIGKKAITLDLDLKGKRPCADLISTGTILITLRTRDVIWGVQGGGRCRCPNTIP